MVVPGHCLAQASREFLQLYPTARILVADETNFVKDKRQRFLARAATAQWDCIIITHSAFKFIPAPGRVRAPADFRADAVLFRPARADRRSRPALAQAHRADEGGARGRSRPAEVSQGRHADDRRDRRRPADRRRNAGVPQTVVRHQPDDAEGRSIRMARSGPGTFTSRPASSTPRRTPAGRWSPPPARRSPIPWRNCSPSSGSSSRTRFRSAASRNSTPGRPISGKRGPSSSFSRPASTSRSPDSASSSMSPI